MAALPWSRTATGLRLIVRLTTRAARDALGGTREDDAGRALFLARVASPPIDGGANAALIRLVAKSLEIPKSAITLTAGQTARVKTLEIRGDPAALERALEAMI